MNPLFALFKTKMKKNKRKLNKWIKMAKLKKSAYFSNFSQKLANIIEDFKNSVNPGILRPQQVRILVLSCLIIFSGYVVLVKQHFYKEIYSQNSYVVPKSAEEIRKENLTKDLQVLAQGYPIAKMIPYIATKDRKTAAYLIGIAKKESNWGKRKPVLDGQDCYNYWGFRLKQERMGSGGHTCFDNPRQAVNTIASRIDEIIARNDVKSAANMIVWKCGSNCDITGGQSSANKWIRDVDKYAQKVLN